LTLPDPPCLSQSIIIIVVLVIVIVLTLQAQPAHTYTQTQHTPLTDRFPVFLLKPSFLTGKKEKKTEVIFERR